VAGVIARPTRRGRGAAVRVRAARDARARDAERRSRRALRVRGAVDAAQGRVALLTVATGVAAVRSTEGAAAARPPVGADAARPVRARASARDDDRERSEWERLPPESTWTVHGPSMIQVVGRCGNSRAARASHTRQPRLVGRTRGQARDRQASRPAGHGASMRTSRDELAGGSSAPARRRAIPRSTCRPRRQRQGARHVRRSRSG
jgi:hypothetical protein